MVRLILLHVVDQGARFNLFLLPTNDSSNIFLHLSPLPILLIIFIFITKVNFKLNERITHLMKQMFDSLDGLALFSGMGPVSRAAINFSKNMFPSTQAERWKLLSHKEDIFDIVEDPKDIPHWWNKSTATSGARRDPSDPREYWCWRRCLGDGNRITVRDVFNPDADTWLDCCEVLRVSKSLCPPQEPIARKKSRKLHKKPQWVEKDEANMVKRPSCRRVSSRPQLEPIEEGDEEEDDLDFAFQS